MKPGKHWTSTAVVLLVVTASGILDGSASAQVRPVLVKIDNQTSVVSVGSDTQAESVLYRVQQAGAWLRGVQVAPSGELVAVLESSPGVVRNGDFAIPPKNRLVILNANGAVLETIEHDVRRFTWCCDGRSLALISGAYHEGGMEFVPDSVFIHSIASRTDRLVTLPVRPSEVAWAPFDSSVYLGAPASGDSMEVWRYEPRTGSVGRTPYRDLRFSPSGAYYLASSDGLRTRPGWHLVERVSGREVPLPDTSNGIVVGWAFNQGDHLLLVHTQVERERGSRRQMAVAGRQTGTSFAVYDLSRRRITQRGNGSVGRELSASAGVVPVMRNGRLEALRGPTP